MIEGWRQGNKVEVLAKKLTISHIYQPITSRACDSDLVYLSHFLLGR